MEFVIFAHSYKMDAFITYQQDSAKVNNLIHTAPKSTELRSKINVEKPVSKLDITEQKQAEQTKQQKTYTPAQIRKWRIQQENKLLVDSSKYMTPRTEIELSYTENIKPNVILPIRELNYVNTDWLTAIIFLGLILFASVRYAYAKYMEHLFLSLFNYPTSVRMFHDKNYPVFHGAFRLEAIFYIIISVFIFQALNFLKWENALLTPLNFLIVFGVVVFYFFCKKFVYLMLGSLFESTFETREYLFNVDNFNRSLGLILLPIVILVSFSPSESPVFIVYAGIIVIALFNLMLLQRGIFILLKKQFSIFYLFLYLCTLEFLPLLLIYKVVVE